jgi:monooxygenase
MATDHVDVLIVGAGLSGIGAAHHLQSNLPGKSYAILESRDAIGGTWDLFRYPGIRADSDMFTLGYSFRPWIEAKAIADGPSILQYVRDTAREGDIERHIRFGHKVVRAEWSTPDAQWTITAQRTDSGEEVRLTASFIFSCTGYYHYDEGFTPTFPGVEDFAGTLVHPQHWPQDLDYTGKKVIVIGSGATAVTLVPAMAETAAHVTMLQRSPTYVMALPGEDPIANVIRRVLPTKAAYGVVRWKNVITQAIFFQASRRAPGLVRRLIARMVQRQLPGNVPLDPHFTPTYNPWDQRVCLVPDGDLFAALRAGSASVVTDTIETFTPTGVTLAGGTEIEADVVVSATGLKLLALGGLSLVVDGADVDLGQTVAYKGMLLGGVPNLAFAVGYTNASWTLKCDLTCEYVCRLIQHMDATRSPIVKPKVYDPALPTLPFVDLKSGYIQRALADFPKQGQDVPWRLHQNYARDIMMLRRGALEDGVLEFSSPMRSSAAIEPAAA